MSDRKGSFEYILKEYGKNIYDNSNLLINKMFGNKIKLGSRIKLKQDITLNF